MRFASYLASVTVLAGCAGNGGHPPGVSECSDAAHCSGSGAGGSAGTGGSGMAGGAGVSGAGAGGGEAAGAGHTLSGNVAIYADALFDGTNSFTGQGKVGLTGSSRVVGTIAAGKWTVAGAEATPVLWADLHATVAGDAMDTLEVVDGTKGTADVVFGSHSAFENMVTGLSSAQSVSPDRAQIVLKFVNAANQPVSRVKVDVQGAAVAYDAGDAYTDAQGAAPLGATQGRGMAIIVNYSAGPFPGSATTIQYVALQTNSSASLDLRVASGAVTFRTVVVP